MSGDAPITLADDDPMAARLVLAIRTGNTAAVKHLLADDPRLARARLGARGGTRTPLHIVTDWPGYFPEGPQMARLLIAAGAEVDALTTPKPQETPLHWAASSDDVDVAAVLIDAGADIEKPDGSIGTPLDNAIGYSCWHVARLLAARGARVDKLWHAAPLGMLTRLEELLAGEPTEDEISQAFWHACAGGPAPGGRAPPGGRGQPGLDSRLCRRHTAGCRHLPGHPPGERHHLAARTRRPLGGPARRNRRTPGCALNADRIGSLPSVSHDDFTIPRTMIEELS